MKLMAWFRRVGETQNHFRQLTLELTYRTSVKSIQPTLPPIEDSFHFEDSAHGFNSSSRGAVAPCVAPPIKRRRCELLAHDHIQRN